MEYQKVSKNAINTFRGQKNNADNHQEFIILYRLSF